MNKTYKIMLPRNKEAQNIKTNIKDGIIEVEVEFKEKWEPSEGEICYLKGDQHYVFIFKEVACNVIYSYIALFLDTDTLYYKRDCIICDTLGIKIFRPATNSEKQLLFDALAKEGKMWDAEKKQVVDLPRWRAKKDCCYYYLKNCNPIVRPNDDHRSEVDRFLHDSGNYFKTEEAAERVAEQIREIFKNSKAE